MFGKKKSKDKPVTYASFKKEKKSLFAGFGKKVKRGFIKLFAVATLVGGPVGYFYGTVKTEKEQITKVTKDVWDYYNYSYDNERTIRTADGDTYQNKKAFAHYKRDKDVNYIQSNMKEGEVYMVKSYGFSFIGGRNIISFEKVADIKQPPENAPASSSLLPVGQAQDGNGAPAPTTLSGQMTDIIIEFNNMSVEMTVPTETVKDGATTIKITKITKKEPVRIIQN